LPHHNAETRHQHQPDQPNTPGDQNSDKKSPLRRRIHLLSPTSVIRPTLEDQPNKLKVNALIS
jgi:hypothetical protein